MKTNETFYYSVKYCVTKKVLLQDESSDYLNRCILLEEFKNKFETLMSADIISSFNSKSIGIKN